MTTPQTILLLLLFISLITFSQSYEAPTLSCEAGTCSGSPLGFSDQIFKDIAKQVQAQVDIPFAPAPLVAYCLQHVLQHMGQDLSPDSLQKLHQLLTLEETPSEHDDWNEEEIQQLADQVTQELAEKAVIDLPMLDKDQEEQLLQKVVDVVFHVLTTSEKERRAAWTATSNMVGDLLASEDKRRYLAQKINEKVDIPLIGEGYEEKILLKAVDKIIDTLQSWMPPDLVHLLQEGTDQGLAEMKQYLVDLLNEKVDIYGFSEEHEGAMISTMMDLLISAYADDADAAALFYTAEEQREKLQEKLAQVDWEIQASKERFEIEQARLHEHKERIEAMLNDLEASEE